MCVLGHALRVAELEKGSRAALTRKALDEPSPQQPVLLKQCSGFGSKAVQLKENHLHPRMGAGHLAVMRMMLEEVG